MKTLRQIILSAAALLIGLPGLAADARAGQRFMELLL